MIAIIDDGIDRSKLLYHNLKYNLFVDDSNEIREWDSGNHIFTHHGTMCARIIETYAPKADFISISVFQNTKLKTNCERLFAALNWCLENEIQLVHMSVGTDRLMDSLMIRPVIARMLMQGQIIVAAGNNKGSYTIPACLGGVIGVIADKKLMGFTFKACYSEKGILLSASSRHKLTDLLGNISETDISNSYAAPTVTAAIHNILMNREPYSVSVPSLYRELTEEKLENHLIRPDFIEDAYVLNLSGKRLLNHRFFFSCKEEITTFESLLNMDEYGKSFVFLPSMDVKENKKVFDFMKNYQKQFKGILFAVRIERELLNGLEDILTWNENNGDILRWNHSDENLKEHECPTIFITDDGENGIDLACNLQKIFQEEGYQCICISNQKYSYLYGLEYIPSKILIDEAIQYVNFIYEPDLIIFCSRRQSINDVIMKDVNNYIVEFANDIERKEEKLNQSVMVYPYDKSDLENLYRHITVYFL
nr:S8 family serine peptidase [Anaerocolumna aminovalerica]